MPDADSTLAALEGVSLEELRSVLVALESGDVALPAQATGRILELLAHSSKEVRRRAAGALATALARGVVSTDAVDAVLADQDPGRRFGAAFAMSRASRTTAAVIDVAVEALGAADGDVRWAAAGILCSAASSDDAMRTRLTDLTVDASIERRKMALYCLRDLGVTDAAVYLSALGDSDANVRVAGLAGIGRAGKATPEVIARLIDVARTDPVAGVRRAAVGVLGMTGTDDLDAQDALREFVNDADVHAARAAQSALARAGAKETPQH
ncbi:MAG TPA: HEAT repeat domain-containing protein [Candidatus Binatia bacterium]|nr:HEAT repeat domain-containing protein [Candidatus Binatia bacterium]